MIWRPAGRSACGGAGAGAGLAGTRVRQCRVSRPLVDAIFCEARAVRSGCLFNTSCRIAVMHRCGTAAELGVATALDQTWRLSNAGSERVAWIVRLVKVGVEGETCCNDVMAFERPVGLRTMADLGLTLAEAKQLLTAVQQQVVAEQAADHSAHLPTCPGCGSCCGAVAAAASRTIDRVLSRPCSARS
jgi:hypothetical protein